MVPLQGREALSDTMEDMLMNLAGAELTAIAITASRHLICS